MKDKKQNIKKAIESLPKYKAPDRVWNFIEGELVGEIAEVNIDAELLPEFKAPERVWKNLEHELSETNVKSLRLGRKIFFAAAGVAALICLVFLFSERLFYPYDVSVEYVEEQIDDFPIDPNERNHFTLTNIIANCEASPVICSSQEFKDFNAQLKEVNLELEKLEKIISWDADPHLIKFYYRLENERAIIEKSIIKLFV